MNEASAFLVAIAAFELLLHFVAAAIGTKNRTRACYHPTVIEQMLFLCHTAGQFARHSRALQCAVSSRSGLAASWL